MAEIRFTIPTTCNGISADYTGFVGPTCHRAAADFKRLMEAMGVTLEGEEVTPKSEAFAVEVESTVESEERGTVRD